MDKISIAEAIQMFDGDDNSTEMSLEAIIDMVDFSVGGYDDILRLKRGVSNYFYKTQSMTSVENLIFTQQPGISVPIVDNKDNESTIVIDDSLLFGVFAEDSNTIISLITQVEALPQEAILNVIIEVGVNDLNMVVMIAGSMISNLIGRAKCRKVFNFGSEISIVELMIAMCCSEVYVSDFAAVSIVKADNGDRITRYIVPVYKFLVKATYKHWIDMGLFTGQEVAKLYESEADNSIQLLSPVIKERLKQKSPQR